MIGRLTGRVVEEGDALVIDVNGVGYEVLVPLGTRGRLGAGGADAGGLVTLFVHTHVREDTFALYGFASADERDAFRVLIAISNVGPKLAMSVLGALAVGELAQVVARGEVAKLVAIPGVGKKTAERLVLELKGKLALVTVPGPGAPSAPKLVPGGAAETLVGTLTRMGFRPAEAERAVTALAQGRDLGATPLGDLVREALALLSR